MPTITPRVLKGFRDFLPDAEMARASLVKKLEQVFASFGFVPIDTPVLEYAEILLGKGGGETDKQVYRFLDHGERDVAMRFDLTVPFARFMAEHVDELYLPFRRYHIAKVWRGENTQRGRYREFMQCDFDIVGTDSASADADIVLTAAQAMTKLQVGDFSLRVNHRALFNRFLAHIDASDKSVDILRAVDKLEKIGQQATANALSSLVGSPLASDILEFIRKEDSFEATLDKMHRFCAQKDQAADMAKDRMLKIMECVSAAGFENRMVLDPSITRGLDYYTGMVLETTLAALPEIGSVCSGGRYDELASLYTDKKLPGVGASVGLDRLMAALEAIGKPVVSDESTQILIINQDDIQLPEMHRLANLLRADGFAVEVFPEPKKVVAQYTYAERKHIPLALFLGNASKPYTLRVLGRRENIEIADFSAIGDAARKELDGSR
ncbi:Histidine--tRNA ligase [uncultured spirochete]|jgi:histidyl-tRNA synthetase|uniref:Histidine--tRNA ligase n=1 Tax=uncultured spirochete TaxID=156406 RepID=A0A3P3XFF4_9SPIR|nr:histidine--tRNA ligase [Rectinema subterraneum]SLM10021.1 Histidine--tRNA ligase [uncultured spirochete]